MPTRDSPAASQLSVRLLAWIFLVLILIFGAQLGIDLWTSGQSLGDLHVTPDHVKALASTVSRAFNNLTTMVLAFIAIAIPLTANMYTPRLIEIFIGDRINLSMLVFFALMSANAIFVQAAAFEQWVPRAHFVVAWTSGVFGFAVLIPYYLYVVSFLDPDRIIDRVRRRITDDIRAIPQRARPLQHARRRLDARILHLGNVILRAVDRADRDVSLSAITALRQALECYLDAKRDLPPEWFDANADLFVGLSDDALRLVRTERNWVEHRCLGQLLLAYNASLSRMPDAISAISDVNRHVALHARACGDDGALRLSIRYFNTYVRTAIRKRDVHAIYDVFSQYKLLARELAPTHPDTTAAIARYVRYYAEFARHERIPFVYELAASDLGALAEAAFADGSPCAGEVLEVFLSLDGSDETVRMTTARGILAGSLRQRGFAKEADRVVEMLRATPARQLRRARKNLEETTELAFWEVTDRQRNLDYLEPALRDAVLALLDSTLRDVSGAMESTP